MTTGDQADFFLPIDSEDCFKLLVNSIEDYAIFILDRQGIVRTWNPGAQKIKGYAASEIVGRPFTVFYPEDVVLRGWPQEELQRATALGRFEDEGWRVRKDGTRFWANVVITALRDEQGQVRGFAKITRDLSERRRTEELLRQSEERFRLLVDSVRDYAVYMLSPQGVIESWNAGAQTLKGYRADEVMGRHFSMFYTAEDRAAGKPARELEDAVRLGVARDEGWRVRKDGGVFWAVVTVTPVHDGEGRLRGFAKVTRDMTEQRRLVELEHSARRISQFLAVLGHELRNPLAPIRNAVGIMHLDRSFPEHLRLPRDIVDRQLTHLTRLVDDLLDVGRITSGKIVLRREPMAWREVVERSIEAVRPQVEARRHHLTVDLPPEPLVVNGDAIRLAQILQNLLSNAVRYTPEGGQISLHSHREGEVLVTRVTDNGWGIGAEALGCIFDLFVQEAPHGDSAQGGLGIGLALARTLAEQHGGSLSAASGGRGQGSTFTLSLPLADAGARQARPEQGAAPAPGGCRVLVVDDNRDAADTMAALITAMGHPARAAYDGQGGVSAAREYAPCLILLDLNMPGQGGFEVLAALRELDLPRRPRIVAVTGYGQPADRARTAQAGFDAHLTKPVDASEVMQILAEVMAEE